MYYFDNTFLKQYIDQKIKLQVFVDSEWYSISNNRDLIDGVDGIGYDVYGKDHRFDYRDIEKIKVGQHIISIDMLQQMMVEPKPVDLDKKDAGKGGSSKEAEPEEEPMEEPEEEEPASGGPKPELSHYDPYTIGRRIIKEYMKERNRAKR